MYIDEDIARSEMEASTWEIFQTFILPGSERKILLPHPMLNSITSQIEEMGRNDPEVFRDAKDYVFQLMERDAFPGFLKLGKPVARMFRKSKSLAGLVQKMALGGRYMNDGILTPERLPK